MTENGCHARAYDAGRGRGPSASSATMPICEDPVPRLKEELRIAILDAIGRHSQLSLARTLGLDEPRMSDLQSGNLERFGLQKLVRLLARINRRIEITVIEVGPVPRPLYGPRPSFPFPPGWENYEDWYPRDLLPPSPNREAAKHRDVVE